MYRYDATVRLAGSPLHEVQKENLSASEILILRAIHGDDAVVNIKWKTSDRTPHADERERLIQFYGEKAFEKVFGTGYNIRLPNELPDVKGAPAEDKDEADAEKEAA
jgi:hypothetical protein